MVATVAAAERQLIVVVEGTAAMGPYWKSIVLDYLERIIRSFFANENSGQKLPELALVVFNSHGPYSACLVQRSGWIKDIDMFLRWLSTLPFNGGGFNEGAVAHGLAEASLMFSATSDGNQSQQIIDCHKHCILVAASNPHPLPTPVPRLHVQNMEKAEMQTESFLADAETVAKSFAQSPYSLSVISPKQLPKLRAIYNAGKHNSRAPDPSVDHVKNPHFLVLVSEHFVEARSALSPSGAVSLPLNQGLVKVDGPPAPPVSLVTPVSLPPSTSMPTVNVPMLSRPSASGGNLPVSTVKVEPTTLSAQAFSHQPSISSVASQGISSLPTSSLSPATQEISTNTELTQEFKPDFKPVVNPISTLRSAGPAAANVNILNNLSQARQVINSASISSMGLPTMGVPPMAVHMSNMISNGMGSSALSGMTSIPGSGTLAATTQAAQNTAMSSLTSTNSNISGNSNIGISSSLPNPQANIGMGQSLHGIGQTSLNSGSQMGQSGISANQNIMTSLGASSISSGAGTMIPTPGMSQTPPQPDSLGVANGSTMSMSSQQHVPGAQQSQSNYVKIWEGALSGQRAGQPVYICKLEGYRNATASPRLAEDWPDTMQIVRLISQDHMNNKQYVGKADLLVFRPLNQHGFLAQLHDKKLCAVIQLPSQTLLLSVTNNKTSRLIGMLFPGDTVVFKPQLPSQQQQQLQQQQQQLQQQQMQQQQIQQHQAQQPQRPQIVGTAMNQTFSQVPGRSQMMSQGMMQQQGNMSGGNFLP